MKRVLGKMERFLEALVEGVFGRDADSLPAGILRKLATEIEGGLVRKGDKRWAPPECHIVLTREAMRLVIPIQADLEEELRVALARLAEQSRFAFPSPLRFKFGVGDGQGAAVLSVKATFSLPPPEESQKTQAIGTQITGSTKVFRHAAKGKSWAWLRVEEGPDRGREFPLVQGKMAIGRQGDNHVALNDPSVSRQHAAISFERGAYLLCDLGSTNGTIINDQTARKQHLREGDRIKLGQTVLVFHCRR